MTAKPMTGQLPAISLARDYPCRNDGPVIRSVSPAIFQRTYFTHCLRCDFCHDQCCMHGVDIDLRTLRNIERHAADLERFTGLARDQWFRSGIDHDPSMPGGGSVRTRVRNGRCVFLNRRGRGCMIHAYALQQGVEYHELKSLVDCLFPLTWDEDLLCPAIEVDDGSLVCLDTGPTLYRGARDELSFYFGPALVAELDLLEASVRGNSNGRAEEKERAAPGNIGTLAGD